MTTTVLNTKVGEVESRIKDTKSLVITTFLNATIWGLEYKISDHVKYITTPEFNKSTADNFAARLKQTNLVSQTDFDNKIISFNRNITSNKTKYLEVKKLNGLTTKEWNSFFGRMYFTSTDGSQNTFLYQPTLDELELKKKTGTD